MIIKTATTNVLKKTLSCQAESSETEQIGKVAHSMGNKSHTACCETCVGNARTSSLHPTSRLSKPFADWEGVSTGDPSGCTKVEKGRKKLGDM